MNQTVAEALVPASRDASPDDAAQRLELYRMMVASSENLVNRRQGLNTFFLTLHGALITAVGFLLGSAIDLGFRSFGLAGITVVGFLFATAWKNLLVSFGQLNTGKFAVINEIEKNLPVAIYTAEWVALGEGKDPKLYRSFTEREVWVPQAFRAVYVTGFSALLLWVLASYGPVGVAWVFESYGPFVGLLGRALGQFLLSLL